MTGFVGGLSAEQLVESMSESLYWEDWYEATRRTDRDAAIGIAEHSDKDSASNLIWQEDGRLGVLYGVLSNESARLLTPAELFTGVLDRPETILPELDGPFAMAAIDTDADRVVLATDKVGSRPCYYTSAETFAFSSEISPLVPLQETPKVDERAVGDLLTYGSVFGEKTVLDGVTNLPPATYLTYEGGSVTTTQYWSPEFGTNDPETYVDGWLDHHSQAIDNLTTTIDDSLNLWLSGGIDSRVTAGALRKAGCAFDTLTYSTGEGGNREAATQVADQLDVSISEVPRGLGSSTDFVEGIEKSVDAVDAMSSWAFVPAIPFVFEHLSDVTDVIMGGGTFLGEDIFSYYTKNDLPPVETLYQKRHLLSTDEVTSLMTDPVRPRQSLHEVVDRTGTADPGNCSVHAMRRLYSYLHMRSNIPQRTQAGTRVVSNGPFLDHVLNMPDQFRLGTVPFTNGQLPLGVSRMKLEAVRGLGQGLEDIPYERSAVPPAWPFWAHIVGAGSKELASMVSSTPTNVYLKQYLNDGTVRSFIDDLVEDARERPFFDGEALATLHDDISDGRNLIPIAAIVGLELWLQKHVDPLSDGRRSPLAVSPSH